MGAGQSFSSNNKRRDDQRFTDVGKEPDRLLPPLPPMIQLHSSTSSLHEAIKPIQHLVEDLPNRVTYSLERCKNPKDGLTNDESAAIFLYTLEWPLGKTSFYTVFNRVLRDGNRAKLVPFHQYLNLIMSAFNKLPSIQDRVWRGETGDLSTQYQLGTIHVWWGVSSCADMVHVTDNFRDQIKKLTLFNVKCINGKIIKNHSEFSDENEIVLPPGTYLKVKSSLNATANLCIVHLEQIVPTPEEMAQLMTVADTLNKISGTQQVDNIYVLWLDPTVNQSEENKRTQEKLKQLFHNRFKPFEQLEEAVHYIQEQKTQRFLLITGGQIGRQIVPKINNLLQVQFVVVYCRDKQANEQWSKDYEKVKAVVVQAEEMVKTAQQLHKDLTEEQESVLSKNGKCSNLRSAGIANEPQEVLSAIDGFEDQPLFSLEESLRELIHIIPELQKYIYITMLNCKNPADDLTQNESAAIQIYTMYWESSENCLSHLLNKDFRSGSRNVLRKWFPYLKLFLYALNKLPTYKGTVWHSVKIDINDRFEVGQTRAWRSFVATTPDISILESSGNIGEHGPRTLFSIECENGKCIKKHLYCPTGDEVLLLPGFYFEVTYNLNVGNGLHIIGLKEIVSTLEGIATATLSVPYTSTQQVNNIYVLWLDPTVNQSEENKRTQEKLKQLFHNKFKPFQQLEEAMHYIQNEKTQRFLLITGGFIGSQIVPQINNLSQLQFVIVYCINKQKHEQWSKDYEKVKAVVVKADEMIKTVQKLHQDLIEQQQSLSNNKVKFGDISYLSYPLHGVMDQPLLSLTESLQEITHIIPDLQKYIYIAMITCKNPTDGLTQNESAAIHIYTMKWKPSENCLSHLLNQDLRLESQNALRKWFPYLKLFLYALNKLPSYKGTVWRCIPGDVAHQFAVKQTGTWWAISLTTPNLSFLQSSTTLGHDGVRTLFSIECTNGKRISKYSCNLVEDEILLLPAFCFEVTNQLDIGNGLKIISLKEMTPPYPLY